MSIYTVNGSPVKYGNKWLATDGGTPSGELPPYDSSDAGKALVVNNEGDNVEWRTVGSSITVDQHYDSTSSNAQSGTAVAEAVSTKQDTISDLSDIRSGAEAGATAVQPSALNDYALASSLAAVATSGSYNDLIDTPTIPSGDSLVPSATSADEGKVLTVDSQGSTAWVTPSVGPTYTAGTGIDITGTTISADTTVLATQQDLSGKQDTLTAGSNVTIQNNVISATAAPQVQSDWTENDNTEPSYIQHRPVVKNLIAGTGITITETAQGIVISLA